MKNNFELLKKDSELAKFHAEMKQSIPLRKGTCGGGKHPPTKFGERASEGVEATFDSWTDWPRGF